MDVRQLKLRPGRFSRTLFSVTALFTTVGLVACGSSGTTGSSGSSGSSGGAAQGWTVGVMLDQTGAGAATTAGAMAATNYAVNQLNAQGGINGHKITAKFCDDQSTTQGGATCGSELSGVNSHVVIVLGSNPPSQGAETQLTTNLGLAISAVLLPKKGSMMFQSSSLGTQVVTPLMQGAQANGIHTLGLIYTDDSPGQGQLKAAESIASKYGVKIVPEPMNPTATDVTPQLVKLQQAGIQAIYTATLGTSTAVILSSYHALNMTIPIAIGAGNVNNNFLKSIPFALPDNLFGPSSLILGPDYPNASVQKAWQAFAAAWKAAEPNYPMDQEVATTTYTWCLAKATLAATNASSGQAEATWLAGHTVTCLGAPIKYNNPAFNVPGFLPGALVQAGPAASDGWGPLRTKF